MQGGLKPLLRLLCGLQGGLKPLLRTLEWFAGWTLLRPLLCGLQGGLKRVLPQYCLFATDRSRSTAEHACVTCHPPLSINRSLCLRADPAVL